MWKICKRNKIICTTKLYKIMSSLNGKATKTATGVCSMFRMPAGWLQISDTIHTLNKFENWNVIRYNLSRNIHKNIFSLKSREKLEYSASVEKTNNFILIKKSRASSRFNKNLLLLVVSCQGHITVNWDQAQFEF